MPWFGTWFLSPVVSKYIYIYTATCDRHRFDINHHLLESPWVFRSWSPPRPPLGSPEVSLGSLETLWYHWMAWFGTWFAFPSDFIYIYTSPSAQSPMIVIVFDINHHLLESPRDLCSWRPPATQPSTLSFPSDLIVSPAFPNVPPLPLLILSPTNKENTKSHDYEVKREIN